ncbi:MAG: transglycosylase SLT domain-containing protein [Elusimicrobia bacterium]|nr:transglycosylase SLT domain-containing protein [Elusimicrobiota bacterium]
MDEATFRRAVKTGAGLWALAAGVGAAFVAAELAFPPQDFDAVDAPPGDLRDSLAALDVRAASRPPSPEAPPPLARGEAPGFEARWPEPSPRAEVELEPTPSGPLYASAGPMGGSRPAWTGGTGGSTAGMTVERVGERASRQAPLPVGRVASRRTEPNPIARPQAPDTELAPHPRPLPASRGEGKTTSAGAAVEGITAVELSRVLQGFPVAGGGERLLFAPSTVQAGGGRVGQGAVSMERGAGATLRGFDPAAKGLEAVKPAVPPGPALRAGNAPAIPSAQVPIIIEAARRAGIDPALLAATAARESHFAPNAYRAEPHLKQVLWGKTPGGRKERYFDGSVGPTQVLRSNFLARGIDNDQDAYALENNSRISAGIIRSNLQAFPGNEWKAVAAYNVGQYGAKIGRIPAGGYVDTVLAWRRAYADALRPYLR